MKNKNKSHSEILCETKNEIEKVDKIIEERSKEFDKEWDKWTIKKKIKRKPK